MKDLNEFVGLTRDRFIKYAAYHTTSDRYNEETPSTPGQWDLAKALANELREMGAADVILTDSCYVIARLPASSGLENKTPVGFLAHMDTSGEVSGKDVRPILVENYDGNIIKLLDGLSLDPQKDKGLAAHKGRPIIHTDGSTLLGADDKAGIAIIMGFFEYLLKHPDIKHGPLELIFSPDEETGKGLPLFPMEKIKSRVCYTLDGAAMGELEWECFNAWSVEVKFTGISMHLGTARGKMVNAALMAAVYAAMLPRNESPEATDSYYGYYCPLSIQGDVENASLEIFIRDFDFDSGQKRLEALNSFAKAVEAQFPGGRAEVLSKLQYKNMKEKILAVPEVIEKLQQAYKNTGVEVSEKPIRGGTDGSRLTEMGIPTPNIFTGGRNYHSRREWLSVEEMAASCRVLVELAALYSH